MLRNFITIALRQFRRNFLYSFINVVGLALGLAGSFVMGSWVYQELSYDKHFKDSDRIYRVSVSFYSSGAFASGPEVLKEVLLEEAPEVESVTRLNNESPTKIVVDNKQFEEPLFFADSNFFEVFSYKFISGNPSSALSNPNQLVITDDLALKFFGSADVVGRDIKIGDEAENFTIAGVVESTEYPSHINAQIWLPLQLQDSKSWTSARYYNYAKVHSAATVNDLRERLELIRKEKVFPTFSSGSSYADWKQLNLFDFHVVALSDIHLDPDMKFEMTPGGDRANVYIFLVTSIFLVVIAAINFINLSTAQSIKRAKEVGVRKSLGSSRKKLIFQFLSETAVLSIIAMLIGVGLAEIFLILFESFTNEVLITGIFQDISSVALFMLVGLSIGLLAGIYPAFYLSYFKPSRILRGANAASGSKGSGFRNFLVILQFTISITLIVGSLFVYQQLDFLKRVDLGFDRENVLIIENAGDLELNKASFKNELLQFSGVESVSYNKRLPAGRSMWLYSFQSEKMEKSKGFQTFIGDEDFVSTMGFQLLEGRNFSADIASDSNALILNESAVKEMLLDKPVGTVLKDGAQVIGVISDFSYQTFKENPGPVALIYDPDGYRLAIKTKEGQAPEVLNFIKERWEALEIEEPLNYSFLDKNLERLMEKEKTLGKTVTFFTSIAIIISCLGLFGLAAHTAQQKKKEIGIRKVFGASAVSIVMMLNKKFTKQVVVSLILAAPISWYLIAKWLQNFTYKVDMQLWVFLVAGVAALLIAWLTVSQLSFRAASANPVDSLRSE